MVAFKFLSLCTLASLASATNVDEDCNPTPTPAPCPTTTPTPEPTPCPTTPEPTPCPITKRCAEIPEGEFFICTAQFGKHQSCLGSKPDIFIPADSDDCNSEDMTIVKPKVYAVPVDLKNCTQNAHKFTVTKVADKWCTYTLDCPGCASSVHESEVVFGPKGLQYRVGPAEEQAELYVKPAITFNDPKSAINFKTYFGSYIHKKFVGKSMIYKNTKVASADLRLYASWEDVRYNNPQEFTEVEYEIPAPWL